MDSEKIGMLLFELRKDKGLTQKAVADYLGVSDKAVSKWERGLGLPDISLLTDISQLFGVDIDKMLTGNLKKNPQNGGNMKKLRFYVCQNCGNVITALNDAEISCCGKNMTALTSEKADYDHELNIEQIENEWYITANHPMSKDHYIGFVALVTGDKLVFRKTYPEWDLSIRLPKRGHGIIYYYCTNHGLFRKII